MTAIQQHVSYSDHLYINILYFIHHDDEFRWGLWWKTSQLKETYFGDSILSPYLASFLKMMFSKSTRSPNPVCRFLPYTQQDGTTSGFVLLFHSSLPPSSVLPRQISISSDNLVKLQITSLNSVQQILLQF